MSSSGVVDQEAVITAFDRLEAAVDDLMGLGFEALTTPEWVALLARLQRVHQMLPTAEHALINLLRLGVPPACGATRYRWSSAAAFPTRWPIGC